MSRVPAINPATDAVTPARIESAPSCGPMVRSSRYVSEAGSAPERRISARSAFCGDESNQNSSPRLWIRFNGSLLRAILHPI